MNTHSKKLLIPAPLAAVTFALVAFLFVEIYIPREMRKHTQNDAPAAAETPADKKPATMVLKIEYPPKGIAQGGPTPCIVRNLDTNTERKNLSPEITVPAGVTNLARDKKVTASVADPVNGEFAYITDGDKDEDEACEVELPTGSQWIQIDLEKSAAIYAIQMWHFYRRHRAYKAITIQISDDPEFVKDVTTVFNTDFENINKQGVGADYHYIETNYGKLIRVSGVCGRHVRFYSAGNTQNPSNHYIEVEIYGLIPPPPPPAVANAPLPSFRQLPCAVPTSGQKTRVSLFPVLFP